MTITLRTETTGIRPEFEHPETSRRDLVREDFGSRSIRFRTVAPCSRAVGSVPTSDPLDVRRWTLSWNDAQYGQLHQLQTAWNDSDGGIVPMTYTPVGELDSAAVQVVFVPDSFEWKRTGFLTYTMSVEIEELRGW